MSEVNLALCGYHSKGSAIKKGQPFVWECHDCHAWPPSLSLRRGGREGVVIPGTYKNIHGERVKIDPKTLDPDTEVMRF